MRIVSLAPSATELLFALDLGGDIVGVTHDCDYPPEALKLPRVTRELLPGGLSAAEVDAAVRERTLKGESIYELDTDLMHALQPELIVTQALSQISGASYEDVRELGEEIESLPIVLALDPHTVGEVLGDARTIAQVTDTKDEAVDLIREASDRIDRIRLAVRHAERPRVIALDWLDPPHAAGEWTPQLIDYAGGEDLLGLAGEASEEVDWSTAAALKPEVVLIMPRSFDAEIAHREAEMHRDQLVSLGARHVIALDANSYFSRPGPRIIDGLELLAQVLHPDLLAENSEYEGKALTVEL
jgi:iron complex transport system substrate-binding protein